MTIRPEGKVHIHDSLVSVWEEPGAGGCTGDYEERFVEDVLVPLIRMLRARGWHVGRDEYVHRSWPSLDKYHRYCTHPSRLEATLEQSGRTIKLEMWQSVTTPDNKNGARYDHDKLGRMPYLMRLRAIAEIVAVSEWLCSAFGYAPPNVSRLDALLGEQRAKPNRQFVDAEWAKGWHKRPLDHEISIYNRRSADGTHLHTGERVWFTDFKGRWMTGIAEPHINNMWFVLWGQTGLRNVASFDLHRSPPANVRVKANTELRERRLRGLMKDAARDERFLRAEQLRRILATDRSRVEVPRG